MLVKRLAAYIPICLQPLTIYSEIWSEIATLSYPPCIQRPSWGVPIGIPGKSLVLRKLESWGYQIVKTV